MKNKNVRQTALHLLARREHSALELKRKLQARGYPIHEIEELLAKLAQQDLLSESRFVESFIHARAARGYGPARIAAELHERGIAEELFTDLLNSREQAWQQLAVEVRQKRFGKQLPNDFAIQAREMRFLQYRGFTVEQIRKIYK